MSKNLFTYLIPAGLLTFLLLLFTNGYPIFTNIVLYETPNCYTKVGYLKAVITNYNIITITNYTSKNKHSDNMDDINNMNYTATTSSHIHITKKNNTARPMNNINNKHISVPVSKNNDNANDTNDSRNVNVSIVYNGEITLMYKTFPHCVFYCKMIVISMQPKESFVVNYININYPVNSVVDAYCNSKGCVYDNFNCNVFTIKDEL